MSGRDGVARQIKMDDIVATWIDGADLDTIYEYAEEKYYEWLSEQTEEFINETHKEFCTSCWSSRSPYHRQDQHEQPVKVIET